MKIIGHRGARGLAPENTIAGLQKGFEHHVDEVEFDLRVTGDGVVVLNHDAELHDPAGNALGIANHAYDELKKHKPDLTTFEEVLSAFKPPQRLHIEIKRDVPVEPIIKVLERHIGKDWPSSALCFASRSLPILHRLQAAFPEVDLVVIELWSGLRATWKARQLKTRNISMLEYWLWSGFISSVAHSGYNLYAFPPQYPKKERFWAKFGLSGIVNNPVKAKRWEKHGLAGVITDYPDRFEK